MPRPILVVNPRSDAEFVAFAEDAVRAEATTPLALEEALRTRYPRAQVRARDLRGEAVTWYVYREGRWIPSEG
jgi:hypothetical protein